MNEKSSDNSHHKKFNIIERFIDDILYFDTKLHMIWHKKCITKIRSNFNKVVK